MSKCQRLKVMIRRVRLRIKLSGKRVPFLRRRRPPTPPKRPGTSAYLSSSRFSGSQSESKINEVEIRHPETAGDHI